MDSRRGCKLGCMPSPFGRKLAQSQMKRVKRCRQRLRRRPDGTIDRARLHNARGGRKRGTCQSMRCSEFEGELNNLQLAFTLQGKHQRRWEPWMWTCKDSPNRCSNLGKANCIILTQLRSPVAWTVIDRQASLCIKDGELFTVGVRDGVPGPEEASSGWKPQHRQPPPTWVLSLSQELAEPGLRRNSFSRGDSLLATTFAFVGRLCRFLWPLFLGIRVATPGRSATLRQETSELADLDGARNAPHSSLSKCQSGNDQPTGAESALLEPRSNALHTWGKNWLYGCSFSHKMHTGKDESGAHENQPGTQQNCYTAPAQEPAASHASRTRNWRKRGATPKIAQD